MVPLEYPPRPEGTAEEQVRLLWEYLFMLVERLNASDAAGGPHTER